MFILKSGRLVSREELSNILGVTKKEILVYKKELDEIFEIESIRGPHGGYKMKDAYFPFKAVLSENEVFELKMLVNKMEYETDENEKLQRIIEKINFSIINSEDSVSGDIIPYSRRNSSLKNEAIELKIYNAIIERNIIIIEYVDNKNKISRRRVEPYKYFIYRGESYLVAKCLVKNEERFFKFVRIKECIVTSFKFEITLDIDKRLNDMKEAGLGIFGQEVYNLELQIKPPMANSIKERIWVENQEIIENPDGSIIFIAKMKGKHSIISWILTMREFVVVKKPEILRREVEEAIKKMLVMHTKN